MSSAAKAAALFACVLLALAWFSVLNPADAQPLRVDDEAPIIWWLRLTVIGISVAYVAVILAVVARFRRKAKQNPFDLPEGS